MYREHYQARGYKEGGLRSIDVIAAQLIAAPDALKRAGEHDVGLHHTVGESPIMYKHVNSASRIHAILTKAVQQPDKAIFQVWADVFGIKGSDDAQTAQLVIVRLHWLHTELQLLEKQVRTVNVSSHLYESAFARINLILNPLHLPASWQGLRGHLSPDVLLALAFCNEFLPDEESSIDPTELDAIADEVVQLSDLLTESSLPDHLKQLIAHHIELIKEALAQYQVFGAKALRAAGRSALGEIIESKDTIAPAQQSDEVSRLGKLWANVNRAADTALKTERIAQLGQRAWDAMSTLLQ